MNSDNKIKDQVLDHLPKDLIALVSRHITPGSVRAAAVQDLDRRGMYTETYLILTDLELGYFARHGKTWKADWHLLTEYTDSALIEGLRLSILRLFSGEALVVEYRFSLRHIREAAKLHRQLQRLLTKKKEEIPQPDEYHSDEKKIRCEKCERVIPPWTEICPTCLSRRKVLTRLLDFAKPYRWLAIGGFALAILVTISTLFRPFLTRPMLDDGLGTAPGRSANYTILLNYILLLAGLFVFGAAGNFLRQRLMAMLGSRISRDIRDKTYAHLHSLSLSFFSRKHTGSLIARVTSDSDRISDFVASTIIEIMISILTVFGVGVALFVLDWRLAGIILLPIPLMCFLTVTFHKKLHRGFDRLFHRWSILTAIVADALPGVRVIKAFSQEQREISRFGRQNREYYNGEVDMIAVWTLFGPVMQFLSHIGTILVWIVGGYWVVRGRMTAGTLMAYVGYMWMFYEPIHMLAHMDRMFNRAASSVQRIFEILDTEPAIFSSASALPVASLKGHIELRNVSFSYDGVRKVLDNINLKIQAGTMIGLAGPSGGGKTTMINLICRFYDSLEGQILIDGVDIRKYKIDDLRRMIGVVLQDPFLFHDTVASNISYGKPDASLDEIIEAARAANAHEFIARFPDGYDTLVGERGHTLSAGERQRISIARAILNNPVILILDEATSSVDTETEKLIQDALDQLIAHRTTIAIAHRLSTLRKADRLVILEQGKIIEEGTHNELMKKEKGLYAKLIRMQAEMHAEIAIG